MKRLLLTFLALVAMAAGVQQVKAQEAYAVYTSSNKTLAFYFDNLRSSRAGETFVLETGGVPKWDREDIYQAVTTVRFDASFAGARPTTTNKWFHGMSELQSIVGLPYLNTSEVTSMRDMFYACEKLTSLDLSSFNTSKVQYMSDMFYNCKALQNLNLSSFNTSNVITMRSMFERCEALTSLDLSSFNTSKVNDMSTMFGGCEALTSLDLSSFDTSNVNNMGFMFRYCMALTTIYVGEGWDTSSVTYYAGMFYSCNNLVGGAGTKYNSSNDDLDYARIDKPGQPGYFTASDEPTTYDLWIAGIQVTKDNKDDLTELVAELSEEAMERYFEGDMEITYDDASQTLTLKNAIIHAATGYGIQSKLSSPKIKLIGENTITADNGMGVRLQPGTGASEGAIICGGGSLNIKASGVGLRSHLNLFLTDGVKITSEGDAIGFQGWKVVSSDDPLPTLTMTGPETMLRTKGTREGSFASYGQLNLQDDIRIMQPSGATFVPNIGIVKDNSVVTDEWVMICSQDYIDGISPTPAASRIGGETFNLAGQKVDGKYKGIVIKDGKKVLVK